MAEPARRVRATAVAPVAVSSTRVGASSSSAVAAPVGTPVAAPAAPAALTPGPMPSSAAPTTSRLTTIGTVRPPPTTGLSRSRGSSTVPGSASGSSRSGRPSGAVPAVARSAGGRSGRGPHEDRDPARARCLHETPRQHVGDLGRGPRGGEVVDRRGEDPGPAVVDEGGRGLERRREVVAHRSLGPFATVEDHEADHERDAAGDPIEDRADGLGRDPRREQERVEAPGQARRDDAAEHPAHDRRDQDGGEREHEVRIAGEVLAQADLQEEGPDGERHGQRHAGNPLAPDPAGSQPAELVRGPCPGGRRARRRASVDRVTGATPDRRRRTTGRRGRRRAAPTGSVPRRTTFQRQRSARRAM